MPFPYDSYFDGCRKKRNRVEYDMANIATMGEVDELITLAEKFRESVEGWIRITHPAYAVQRSR
jgi:hypothetical protein